YRKSGQADRVRPGAASCRREGWRPCGKGSVGWIPERPAMGRVFRARRRCYCTKGEHMSQYGEPWELLGGIEPTIMAGYSRRIVGADGFDASLPDEEWMRRIVRCVNNCAGLSDENLQTLLDNGHTLAGVIFQMQKGHPIFAQVHSQQGQVVY